MKILVAEPLAEEGLAMLREAATVEILSRPSPEELLRHVADCDGLIVRSQTRVTAQVIEAARQLKVIARAGVGIDNIDLKAATWRGILVVNAPDASTIAAAEHTLGLMLALARRLPEADASTKAGRWDRRALMGVELYRKTLGIVGLGRIGTEVSRRALALEMKVIAHDPFLSPEYAQSLGVSLVAFDDLLRQADFITLHVPLTEGTRHLIGRRELALAKKGVRLINCARGGVLDEEALYEAILQGQVAGAALDVFEREPPVGSPLLGLPQVVATPHLGSSTWEAQANVAVSTAEQVLSALRGELVKNAINLPVVPKGRFAALWPYLVLADRMGRLLAYLVEGPIRRVELSYWGQVATADTALVSLAALKGLLSPVLEEPVNLVNAATMAQRRAIQVVEQKGGVSHPFDSLLVVKVGADSATRWLEGTLFGEQEMRIVSIDGDRVDFVPKGNLLIGSLADQPGIIGSLGTLLGRYGINITAMEAGRTLPDSRGVMVISVDRPVPGQLLEEVRAIDPTADIRFVDLD